MRGSLPTQEFWMGQIETRLHWSPAVLQSIAGRKNSGSGPLRRFEELGHENDTLFSFCLRELSSAVLS